MSVHQFPYSPQRKNKDESMRKSAVKYRLDTLIQNDYSVLRRGKAMDADDLLLRNHNTLVLDYVRGIYDEYHIADPLADYPSVSRVSLTPSGKKTTKKKKMHLMSSQTIKYSTPVNPKSQNQQVNQTNDDFDLVEDESSLIRKDFIHNNTTIRASLSYFEIGQDKRSLSYEDLNTKYQTLGDDRESELPKSQLTRNRFELFVENETKPTPIEEEASQSSHRGFVAVPYVQLPRQSNEELKEGSFFLQPIPNIQKPSKINGKHPAGYVDQSFRYCVGCDQPLLHANIKMHQQSCKEFQEVFQMPPEEIVRYLKRKISKFQQNIKRSGEQLLRNDVDELKQSSLKMMQESQYISSNGIITHGFEKEYFKVVDIGKKWCMITEEVNKVSWFLKIRERIRQQFQL